MNSSLRSTIFDIALGAGLVLGLYSNPYAWACVVLMVIMSLINPVVPKSVQCSCQKEKTQG